MSETDTESNPFSQLETLGEILGYVYARHGGGPVVRELLDTFGTEASSGLSREVLESGADELESVGMLSAAVIVREYAERAYEAKYQCPWPRDNHPHNAKAWVAMERQRHPNYDDSRVVYADPDKRKPGF
jgi:hypothetical protein